MLFLALICFALALLSVVWFVRVRRKKGVAAADKADLNEVGGLVFTIVSLVVGGVALFLYLSDYLAPAPGLEPEVGLLTTFLA